MIAPLSTSTSAPATCLSPNCDRPAFARGVCNCCLEAAKRLVKSGATTFEELESLNLIEPAVRPRVAVNPLVAAFREKKGQVS